MSYWWPIAAPSATPTGPRNAPSAPPMSFPVHCIWFMVARLEHFPVRSPRNASRGLARIHRGKVRDVYAIDDETLLIVATDRLSAFDVVLPDPIPGKGKVLNTISNFWFARTGHIVRNHLLDMPLAEVVPDPAERAQIEGRSVIARRLKALPIEAIVRGYLIGTGWKDYQATGSVSGIALPAGLRQAAAPAAADLHARPPRPRWATTTRTSAMPRRKPLVGPAVAATRARYLAGAVRVRGRTLRAARHHHRRHEVRVRAGAGRRTAADRRGADAGLLALLAGRQLPGRHQPAQLRQAVRARLPGDAGLEQARAGPATAARR